MSLGLLVNRFSDFVRRQPEPPESVPEGPPPAIEPLHELAGHHLVLLAILARADGSAGEAERRAILEHCVALAEKRGHLVGEADRAALAGYVARFRPSLMQLDPALRRLHHDSEEDIAALVSAAQKVVDADGMRQPSEVKFLAELQQDIERL